MTHPTKRIDFRLTCMATMYGMALLLLGLTQSHADTTPTRLRDAAGRDVVIADRSRIVSIGSSVTEILFALGAGDQVIARDQTSLFPPQAGRLPDVGYSRALSAEGVLSVGPSLILALEGSGPPAALDVLERSSVPVVLIPDAQTPEGVIRKIEAVAAAVGREAEGARLAEDVRADFAAVEADVTRLALRPRVIFVLSAAGGVPVVGGADTGADAMLRLAGARNPMASIKGYKPAVDEAAFNAEPDALLVMSGGGQVLPADMLFGLPAFKGTPAARDKRLVTLPGSYLLGFGPRTPQAVRDLALALHPGAAIAPLRPRPWAVAP